MVENTEARVENVDYHNLSTLFDSFSIDIPEVPLQMSFTRSFLGGTNLEQIVDEIKFLAQRNVCCRHVRDEDKSLETVYVYEVAVKHKENQMVIEEMVNKYKDINTLLTVSYIYF